MNVNVKTQKIVLGKKQVSEYLSNSFNEIVEETAHSLGDRPTLIGELGIPFDLNNKEAYQTNDYSDQEDLLDRSFQSIESNLLHYALWPYVEDNSNELGDGWNEGDLSIYSEDQRTNPNDIN